MRFADHPRLSKRRSLPRASSAPCRIFIWKWDPAADWSLLSSSGEFESSALAWRPTPDLSVPKRIVSDWEKRQRLRQVQVALRLARLLACERFCPGQHES